MEVPDRKAVLVEASLEIVLVGSGSGVQRAMRLQGSCVQFSLAILPSDKLESLLVILSFASE